MKKKAQAQQKELKELKKIWDSLKKSVERAENEMKRIGERVKAGKTASTQLLKNIINNAKSKLKKVNNLASKAKKAGLGVKEPAEKQISAITKKLDAIAAKIPNLTKKVAAKKPAPKKVKPVEAKPKVEKKPPVEEAPPVPEAKPTEPEAPPAEPTQSVEEKTE